MKVSIQSLGYIICACVIIFLVIMLMLATCNTFVNDNKGNTDSTFYWKNKADDLTTSIKGSRQDFFTMQQFYLDSIAKVYKTKTKFIKSVTVITTKGETVLAPVDTVRKETVIVKDCPPQIKSLSQRFANPYYKADVKIYADNKSASYVRLQSFDTLTIVWKRVKSGGLFSRRNYLQIDASTANPYAIVSGIKSYRVPDSKPKKIGIGLQVSYGFSDGIKPKVFAGIGISYNILNF